MSQQCRLFGKFVAVHKVNKVHRLNNPNVETPELELKTSRNEHNEENNQIHTWKHGRRIVEISHIAEQLFCTDCHEPIHLSNIVNENRQGFGSILMVQCECGFLNKVTTGKTHRTSRTGPPVFDVNTKAVLGMIHSGTGHSQISSFMAALEIEGLHHTTMKKREKEVEPHLQTVANQSCRAALLEEVEKQQKIDNLLSNSTEVKTDSFKTSGQFKYDMGWQKRGSGRSYDSKSGVGTLIGNQTGKICAYGIKIKDCRKCSFHCNEGRKPPSHDCKKNWKGSSKAMEASVAVETVDEVEKENVNVSVIIMDDDATTLSKLNEHHRITKWSDINHTTKHLGNLLYDLRKSYKNISTKVIKYLQKCFTYAVIQNKFNPEGLKNALQNIVPHCFGNHSKCDNTWCTYNHDPDNYKHKSLPYGKDLTGQGLEEELNNIFSLFIRNVSKISPCATTREVESFNNTIASKAPKHIHYSASNSLVNRVNSAVAQKNLGESYVNNVNEKIGLSPGTIQLKFANKKDKVRKRRHTYENTKSFKKRKIERKLKQISCNSTCEQREGVTYQANIDLNDSSQKDFVQIPPAKLTPKIQYVNFPEVFSNVFCDIETSSLSKDCDILQLAAVCNSDLFSEYIFPSQSISSSSSAVTGLALKDNSLCLNGHPVKTKSLTCVLHLFLEWLDTRKSCVLIGHNFKSFDFPRILRAFQSCKLVSPLRNSVLGIVDTLPLLKEVCPGNSSYRQEHLVSVILNETYGAHNAENDVCSLQKLCNHLNLKKDILSKHSATTSYMEELYKFNKEVESNIATLSTLIDSKVISKSMGHKIARSGLQLCHLKLCQNRGALLDVLSEKLDGKVRVTSNACIIKNIEDFFNKQQ